MRIVNRVYEHYFVAELVLSSKKQFFGYTNCFVPRNKFQIKACLLKENRSHVFFSFVSKSATELHAHVPLDGAAQTVM